MKRLALGMLLLVLLLVSAGVWPVMEAPAATYYVSPTGNNSNPGTQAQPWATPGYGSRQLQPGDTLIILGGRYTLSVHDADIIMPGSGTATAWITIKGEDGNRPVLAGRKNLISAVDIVGSSYIRLENLEITHDDSVSAPALYFRNGLLMYNKTEDGEVVSSPSHIILKDIYIHHVDEFGLKFQDIDDLQIINCRIEYTGMGGIGSDNAEAAGARRVLIKGCHLARNGYYYRGKILTAPRWDRPDGLGVEVGPGPLEIVDTISEHNFGDGLDSKLANTYIHNCIVANNSCDGIKLWGTGSKAENCLVYGTGDGVGGDSPWAGIVIDSELPNYSFEFVNVTVHDNPTRNAYPMYVQYDNPDVPLNLVMRNCIIANGQGLVYLAPSVNLTAEHNLFYRPGAAEQVEANGTVYTAAQIEAGALGPGNICREPKFVRPAWGATGDYHLRGGSPGIDQGTATGAPAVDLDYRKRPLGKTYDMGAYEFNPGALIPAILPLLLLH